MSKIASYMIISDEFPAKLGETVHKYIECGFEPYGNIVFGDGLYCQAIVMKKRNRND